MGDNNLLKLIAEMMDNGLRLGQIMANVFDLAAKDGYDPFFIEDDKLLKYVERYMGGPADK